MAFANRRRYHLDGTWVAEFAVQRGSDPGSLTPCTLKLKPIRLARPPIERSDRSDHPIHPIYPSNKTNRLDRSIDRSNDPIGSIYPTDRAVRFIRSIEGYCRSNTPIDPIYLTIDRPIEISDRSNERFDSSALSDRPIYPIDRKWLDRFAELQLR